MTRREPGRFLYYAAAILLFLTWLSLFLENDSAIGWLQAVGWLLVGAGIVLIFLPMFVLHRKGQPEEGKDWTHTSTLVDTGIYAVVRHPLYLGWSLMYPALVLASQHWLTVVIALPGLVCVALISKQEDQLLVAKFGDAYERYMQDVPALNLPAGIIRHLRRRNRAAGR
jgi:protein-S-isoprenylcysteine O-methyltransferase Ste14